MLFEWRSLLRLQLLRNRRERPSGGKPQTEVVWFGRRLSCPIWEVFKIFNLDYEEKFLRPAPRVKKKDEKEVGRDLNKGTQGIGQESVGSSKVLGFKIRQWQ